MSVTIEAVAQPNAQQLEAIHRLVLICNDHEGLDLKVNPEMIKSRPGDVRDDFLAWDGQQLVGYLGLYSFGGFEIEASGMVHPDWRRRGIFRQLSAASYQECQGRGITSRLWFSPRASEAGLAWLKSLNSTYHHSEYAMMLRNQPRIQPSALAVEVRPLRPEEQQFRRDVLVGAFNMTSESVEHWLDRENTQSHRRIEIITANGEPAGVIGVSVTEGGAYIFGFAVDASRRGQGIGRQALVQVVQRLQAADVSPIQLEVATENEHALGLYQSCGFEIVEAFDYFSEAIA